MIYKSSFKFKQCERRLGKDVAIEKRGKKIVVNDLTFYITKDFCAVEEKTGLYVPLRCELISNEKTENRLQQMENEITTIYDKILKVRNERIEEGYLVEKLEVWEDK